DAQLAQSQIFTSTNPIQDNSKKCNDFWNKAVKHFNNHNSASLQTGDSHFYNIFQAFYFGF
ncbi:hypothetical protein VP01_3723g2, partial [Puccinia sorghi]